MNRRDFLQFGGAVTGALWLSQHSMARPWNGSVTPIPNADRKALADIALNSSRKAGASYTDVRIGRYLQQALSARERMVTGTSSTESFGAGIRVIADGAWGFVSTNDLTQDGIAKASAQAVAIARANAKLLSEPVRLAPVAPVGETSWRTPIVTNGFEIPIAEKLELLLEVGDAALSAGASFINANLFLVNEQKYFASTDGSYIDQDIHRIWPTFNVTWVDRSSGRFESRASFGSPSGMGWEYLIPDPAQRVETPAGVVVYGNRYDMVEDARRAAAEAREKAGAGSVEAGRWDLVLDPTHTWLTIHESVGHPLELDRVLGYEANYAGTSFASLDKWRSRSFNYASPIVTFFADKIQPGSLGAVGYDDEGVKARRWDLVADGILVNYQAIRDQVHILGESESHGCCYADSWSSVQFQRMPNVSMAPGLTPLDPSQIIANVEKGIYILGDGSYSIDQQRYNFQFGGQLFFEIRNGRIAGMLKDVSYQSNTQEFWNSVVAIADQRDYRLGGSFFDGKGQPGQISAVSHGSATVRVDGVNILNTARRI